MAYSFKEDDLLANIVFVSFAGDPIAAAQFVIDNAANSNVSDLFTMIRDSIPVGAVGIPGALNLLYDELKRVADTDVELELTRVDDTGNGKTITIQAKGKSVI